MIAEIILPIALVVFAGTVKLFVNQTASIVDVIMTLLELPTDIAFLSTSFVSGYVIVTTDKIDTGLLTFIIYVVASIIVVAIWRVARRQFSASKWIRVVLLTVINYSISLVGLVWAINLLGSL